MFIPEQVKRIAEDIKSMRIRGAGRIARAAAKALKIASENFKGKSLEEYIQYMNHIANILRNTRPTAVSLPNALSYVLYRMNIAKQTNPTLDYVREKTEKAADEFIQYSLQAIKLIGEIGARRISNGDIILTHCNSSAALSVIIEAAKSGKDVKVYATETRPKFQGHITIETLAREGIDVTLIPDIAVRFLMKKVDKVIVGADTVTADGSVINKVGTSQIALAAYEARVRFFVATETYKFSPATVIGEEVLIEERSPLEIVTADFLTQYYLKIKVRNPAFDITPAKYVDAIITEKGIIPPQATILILKEYYGWAIKDYAMRKLGIDLEE